MGSLPDSAVKKMTVRMPIALARDLKVAASREDRSVQDVVNAAVREYLTRLDH